MAEQFDGRLLAEIQALDLPHPEDFVLNHSGALAERGIIPIESVGDIDGSTSIENLRCLRQRIGWTIRRQIIGYRTDGHPITVVSTQDEDRRFDLHRWDFSMFDFNRTGNGKISLDAQKEFSDQDPVTRLYVASARYVERTNLEIDLPKKSARLAAITAWREQAS